MYTVEQRLGWLKIGSLVSCMGDMDSGRVYRVLGLSDDDVSYHTAVELKPVTRKGEKKDNIIVYASNLLPSCKRFCPECGTMFNLVDAERIGNTGYFLDLCLEHRSLPGASSAIIGLCKVFAKFGFTAMTREELKRAFLDMGYAKSTMNSYINMGIRLGYLVKNVGLSYSDCDESLSETLSMRPFDYFPNENTLNGDGAETVRQQFLDMCVSAGIIMRFCSKKSTKETERNTENIVDDFGTSDAVPDPILESLGDFEEPSENDSPKLIEEELSQEDNETEKTPATLESFSNEELIRELKRRGVKIRFGRFVWKELVTKVVEEKKKHVFSL